MFNKLVVNKNPDCLIRQALELFYLPTEVIPSSQAIRQALVVNTVGPLLFEGVGDLAIFLKESRE